MNRTDELWTAAQRAFDERRPCLEDETVLAGLGESPEELATLVRLDQTLARLGELEPAPLPASASRAWRGPLAAAAAIALALGVAWWTSVQPTAPAPDVPIPSGDQANPVLHAARVRVETARHAPRQPLSLATLDSRSRTVVSHSQAWKARSSLLSSASPLSLQTK